MGWTEKGCLCPAKKTKFHIEGSEASLKGEIGIRLMYQKGHLSKLRRINHTDEVWSNQITALVIQGNK